MSEQSLQNRREFLKFMGKSGTAISLASLAPFLSQCSTLSKPSYAHLPFTPIDPSAKDDLVLAKGFQYDVLIKWKDKINSRGDQFGFNNDYTAFTPMKKGEFNEGLLWVNHESSNPLFVAGQEYGTKKTAAQVKLEQQSVGGSIVRIKQTSPGKWTMIADDKYNRRIDGTSKIPFANNVRIKGKRKAVGTTANCAGGVTPWSTVLTCEENYDDFYGETIYENGKAKHIPSDLPIFSWEEHAPHSPEHYGWVVEINPFNGKAKKLTALGRFAHESATCVQAKDGRCVVYSGDDKKNEFVYKFISEKPGSLERGELFVANTEKGEWLSLDRNKNELLKKNFSSQKEVLLRCREAARLIGATPQDRPEDIEIDKKTNAVYVCLTNNKAKKNYHGAIVKFEEQNGDFLSLKFKTSTFLAGGEDNGFSSPDNLAFDHQGNLWLACDISGGSMNKGKYQQFKNNGLYYIPLSGPGAGQVYQVASAPTDAEFTGPSFSPDGKTLFLSVQHPGERTKSLDKLRSHWPSGKPGDIPAPAVVTITGPAMDQLMEG